MLFRLLRWEGLIVVAFFFALANVAYAPYIWGHLTLLSSAEEAASIFPTGARGSVPDPASFKGFDPGAPAWLTEPGLIVIHEQIVRDRSLPLWDPYRGFGAPLAADMQEQPFYPLSTLLSLHATPHTYNLFIIARLLLAGIFTYFFLRLFVQWPGAVVAGICCMFTGYLLLFYNMPQLSVDVTLPMLFFSAELHLRRRSWPSAGLLALSVWLILVGGMPESALLALSFGTLYTAFRIVTAWRSDIPRALLDTGVPIICGCLCSAFLFVPVAEFIRHSYNTHELKYTGVPLGLVHDVFRSDNLATYLMPLMFGPPTQNIMTNFQGAAPVRGFFGVLPFWLALTAGLSAADELRRKRNCNVNYVIAFFSTAVVCLIAKRYGIFAVNWVGSLPFFSLIQFPKYEEILTGFSMAALAGFGCDRLLYSKRSRAPVAWAGVLTLVLVTVVLLSTLPLGAWGTSHSEYYFGNLAGGLFFAMLAFALSLATVRGKIAVPAILVLVIVEVTGNFFVPVYYAISTPAGGSQNPYAGSPYVAFLQRAASNGSRIYGIESMLFPNWAGAFHLSDVRNLDAVYYDRYLPFVRAFFPPKSLPSGELQNRFNGDIGIDPTSELEQRFFALSSVNRIVTAHPIRNPNSMTTRMLRQNKNSVETGYSAIAGVERLAFHERQPQELSLHVRVPARRPLLQFGIGLDPGAYADSICGNGTRYRLTVRDGNKTSRVFERDIDPKNLPSERRWIDSTVDLSGYARRAVDLVFSVSSTPKMNTCPAWPLWSDPHFAGVALGAPASYPLLYDRPDAHVYAYAHALPRAAVFYSVRIADANGPLASLIAKNLDVTQTAVVEPARLNESDASALVRLGNALPRGYDEGTIISYRSQSVAIHTTLPRPGLLVLNDTNYPGWNAYLDGRRVTIIPADYLFRGVLVPAGTHQIDFRYEPQSLRTGLWITAYGLVALIAYFISAACRRPAQS
jgi:hypothetical protein